MRASRSEIATTMSAVAAGGDRVVYEREQKGRTGGALMCACVCYQTEWGRAGRVFQRRFVCVCCVQRAALERDVTTRKRERQRESGGQLAFWSKKWYENKVESFAMYSFLLSRRRALSSPLATTARTHCHTSVHHSQTPPSLSHCSHNKTKEALIDLIGSPVNAHPSAGRCSTRCPQGGSRAAGRRRPPPPRSPPAGHPRSSAGCTRGR